MSTAVPTLRLDPMARYIAVDRAGAAVACASARHAYTRDTWLGVDWLRHDLLHQQAIDRDAARFLCSTRSGAAAHLRLPTLPEMLAVLHYYRDPLADMKLFPNICCGAYWTDSGPTVPIADGCGWIVDFVHGTALCRYASRPAFARAVRTVPQDMDRPNAST